MRVGFMKHCPVGPTLALVLIAFATHARAEAVPGATACGDDDLLAGLHAIAPAGIEGDPGVLTDSAVASEGAPWDSAASVRLPTGAAFLFDLGAARSISALFVQADANDTYEISAALAQEPHAFRKLADVVNVLEQGQGHGLRGRVLEFTPVTARYLRITPTQGDGLFSISELAAYCRKPQLFPPALRVVDVAP